ncbi:MAG: acetylglutamate kinase [Bacillus subtilis]|nr:acetylglutamate kinase [Bacillus subtilis]
MKKPVLNPKFVNGLRVTDKETMKIVEIALGEKINKAIAQDLEALGIKTKGLSGKIGNILTAKKKITNDGVDLGFVGEVDKVNIEALNDLLDTDILPVIAPIGFDSQDNSYNINADYAAGAVAGALNADKLAFLTDVEGVLKDVNDKDTLIPKIKTSQIQEYIDSKIISGGMIPKIECCARAIELGVKSVHILDGRVQHSLLLEIFEENKFGTIIEG